MCSKKQDGLAQQHFAPIKMTFAKTNFMCVCVPDHITRDQKIGVCFKFFGSLMFFSFLWPKPQKWNFLSVNWCTNSDKNFRSEAV